MVLSLSCPNCPEIALSTGIGAIDDPYPDPAAVRLGRPQIEVGVDVDFLLEVPPGCPRCSGALQVLCSSPEVRFPEVCVRRSLSVESPHVELTDHDITIWNVDPALRVPDHVAFLYVQERRCGWLSLMTRNRRHALDGDLEIRRPELSLASLIQEGQFPKEFVGRIHAFSSQRIPELQVWFRDLLASYGQGLLLVIVDSTEAEIPWEMIHLKDGYLGAEAEVVRWAQLWDYHERIGLKIEDRDGSGYAIGYLDTGSASSANEAEELDQIEAHLLGSPGEILDRLSQGLADVGLLYVACHGAIAYPQREARRYQVLYDEKNPDELRIMDLDLEFLERQDVRLPAVFVNACHSGRLRGDGEGVFGLPTVFLRKVADGYIGTLGAVNQSQASIIGSRILRAFREDDKGVRPSELLRRLRHEAWKALDSRQRTGEGWLRFLFTFMYVYYGNPLVRVLLRRRDSSLKEEEQ